MQIQGYTRIHVDLNKDAASRTAEEQGAYDRSRAIIDTVASLAEPVCADARKTRADSAVIAGCNGTSASYRNSWGDEYVHVGLSPESATRRDCASFTRVSRPSIDGLGPPITSHSFTVTQGGPENLSPNGLTRLVEILAGGRPFETARVFVREGKPVELVYSSLTLQGSPQVQLDGAKAAATAAYPGLKWASPSPSASSTLLDS